ncbi:MAG: peptidoglycan-binding protein, partial [Methanobrevibacter sp.]|nr:peptidoglycan-binding protein [Methanobrevibacter sp.]
SKIIAKNKSFNLLSSTKIYSIVLKDNNNKVLKNKKVILKLNGKTYVSKTNIKGKATFKLDGFKKMGTFTAVISYAGDDHYIKASKKIKLKFTFKTIKKGSKDKLTVKKIQRALKRNGYYLTFKRHYLKVDGIYGVCTVRSVKEFQRAKGLKVTGKVNYSTAKKLGIL